MTSHDNLNVCVFLFSLKEDVGVGGGGERERYVYTPKHNSGERDYFHGPVTVGQGYHFPFARRAPSHVRPERPPRLASRTCALVTNVG